jgi:AcrR family transcriptional regulator
MTSPRANLAVGGDPASNGNGKITRAAVLAAALEIIDRDGADALSMRRLARVLNRDPMILYRHARNKAALLDGVAETVLAQLHVNAHDPDWPTSSARSPATSERWRWPTRTSCR